MAVLDVVVGRQPVFDRELDVMGYELLFRPLKDDGPGAGLLRGDLMTSTVLFSSVAIGINRLVGDKLIFCNADRGLLVGDDPVVLPAERTVIEIQESVLADDDVVAGCRRLANEGFALALDHFSWFEGAEQLLELATIVKFDLLTHDRAQLASWIERCRRFDVGLVAERVETPAHLDEAKSLGFDYFQGYLLSRPRIVPGKALDSSSLARLQLASALVQGECSAEQLEDIVKAEPAMAYQLLQMAGVGSDHGFRRRVRTLREALVIIGWRQLQSWIAFLLMTHQGETSEEEVVTTLVRARMCEILAAQVEPRLGGFGFTAGMLSAFGLLLGSPIEEVLISLPLDAELHDAVLGRNTEVGRIVADAIDYQLGKPESAVRAGFDDQALYAAAMKALTWAVEVSRGFVRSGKTTKTTRRLRQVKR